MTWQQATAQWRGSDYSAIGLTKGQAYPIEYRITPTRTIELRLPEHPDAKVWQYANLAAFGRSWKVQPGA